MDRGLRSMQLQLENKVILITGGAKGIGAAITRVVADEGGIPVMIDRDEEAGKKIEQDLMNAGGASKWIGADLSGLSECRQAVGTVGKKYTRIGGVGKNWGVKERVGLESGRPGENVAAAKRELLDY